MRPTAYRWLGTSLFGSLLVLGCNQGQRQPDASCSVACATVTPATPYLVTNASTPPKAVLPDAPPVALTPPATVPAPAAPEVETEAAGYTPPAEDKEATVARKSFTDVTAKPGFAHAPDYAWVQGDLHFITRENAWRLRYASVDEEDKYGGGVTLVDVDRQANLKEGVIYRVEGQIIDADKDSFRYRVQAIQPMGNP